MQLLQHVPRNIVKGFDPFSPNTAKTFGSAFYFSRIPLPYLSSRNMNADISGMRIEYDRGELIEDSLVAKEPIAQFTNWFEVACKSHEVTEANAVCLSTATSAGRPSSRMVLLKGFSQKGFKFYTNYDSRKGREIAENPFVALTFFWEPLRRSIRIEGMVTKLCEADSVAYFNSRPRESQLGACASNQSHPVAGKQALADKFETLTRRYADLTREIPKPDNWGGYLVIPESLEFWQGQKNRMHDRIKFRRPNPEDVVDNVVLHQGDNGWVYERLSP